MGPVVQATSSGYFPTQMPCEDPGHRGGGWCGSIIQAAVWQVVVDYRWIADASGVLISRPRQTLFDRRYLISLAVPAPSDSKAGRGQPASSTIVSHSRHPKVERRLHSGTKCYDIFTTVALGDVHPCGIPAPWRRRTVVLHSISGRCKVREPASLTQKQS